MAKKTITLPDIRDFELRGYRRKVTERGQKVTAAFYPEDYNFPSIKDLSAKTFEQPLVSPLYFTISQKADGAVYYAACQKRISRSGRKLYPSVVRQCCIGYTDGKAKVSFTDTWTASRLVAVVLLHRGLEALVRPQCLQAAPLAVTSHVGRTGGNDEFISVIVGDAFFPDSWGSSEGTVEHVDDILVQAFGNKTVLKGILTGRITNRHDMISRLLSAAYGVRGVNIGIAERFFLKATEMRYAIPEYRDYATSVEDAMRLNTESTDDASADAQRRLFFKDLLTDARKLDKVVNPRWSLRRMREEHQHNIKAILEAELDAKDDTDIYGGTAPFEHGGYVFEPIRSCREAFLESKMQNNCLFYNYWARIREGRYLAFRVTNDTTGERYTAGATVRHADDAAHNLTKGVFFDQIYANHNTMGPLWNAARDTFAAMLEDDGEALSALARRAADGGTAATAATGGDAFGMPFPEAA